MTYVKPKLALTLIFFLGAAIAEAQTAVERSDGATNQSAPVQQPASSNPNPTATPTSNPSPTATREGNAQSGNSNPAASNPALDSNPNRDGLGQANNPNTGVPNPAAPAGETVQPASLPAPVPAEPVQPAPIPAAPVPVSAADKSEGQRSYEADRQSHIDKMALELKRLRGIMEKQVGKKQTASREYLRTAAGNRSIAITKLKNLLYAPPADWVVIRNDIDKAIANLEVSVEKARAFIEAP